MIKPPSLDEVLLYWKVVAPTDPTQPTSKRPKIDTLQVKNNILYALKNFSTFSAEDQGKIENLKAEVLLSGDTDFLERIKSATRRLILGKPYQRSDFGLNSFPTDLLIQIFSYIRDIETRKALHTLCRQFASLLNNPTYLSEIINNSGLKLTCAELNTLLAKCGHKVTKVNLSRFMGKRDIIWKEEDADAKIGHFVATIIEKCPRLVTLNLGGRSPNDDDLKELTTLQNLTSLNLQGANITMAFIPNLALFENLRNLKIDSIANNADVMRPIFTHANLVEFQVSDVEFTNNDLKKISREYDVFAENYFKKNGLKHEPSKLKSLTFRSFLGLEFPFELSRFQSLIDLNLSCARLTTLQGLSLLSNLTNLNCDSSHILDDCMEEVVKLSQLRNLNICYTRITDKGVGNISRLENLQWLFASEQLTAKGYEEIGKLTNLRVLKIEEGGKDITLESMKEISKLTNLVELSFPHTVSVLSEVSKMTSLTNLDMSCSTFETDARASIPVYLTNLTSINMAYSNLDDKFLRNFNFPQLSSIILNGTQVTDGCVDQLVRCSSLTAINLNNTKITNLGKEKLISGLRYLQRLYINIPKTVKTDIEVLEG